MEEVVDDVDRAEWGEVGAADSWEEGRGGEERTAVGVRVGLNSSAAALRWTTPLCRGEWVREGEGGKEEEGEGEEEGEE